MTRLAALHARITGDASGFVKAAQEAGNAAVTAGKKIGNEAVGGLGKAAGGARVALRKLSSSPGMRMLPIQLSQVAQQAAAGGGVLRALSIQAADIGLAFGALGAIVGTLATVAMPLIIGAFSNAGDEADNLKENLDAINQIKADLNNTFEILTASATELKDRFGDAADNVRQYAINLANLQLLQAESLLKDQIIIVNEVGEAYARLAKNVGGHVGRNINLALQDMAEKWNITTQEAKAFAVQVDDLRNATGMEEMKAEAAELEALIRELGIPLDELPDDFRRMLIELNSTNIAAAELEALMLRVANATATARSEAEGLGMTFGEIKALSGLSGADLLPPAPPSKPGRRGGGGGKSQAVRDQEAFERDLERLREQLMTEIELERQLNEERNEMLRQAREQELLTQEEYDRFIERERKRHHDAMTNLDVWRYGTQLDQMETFMGQMASAFATGNEEMLRIAKVFGAGEALINAWRTFSQVMSDSSLPWFAKLPAAISLFGSAVQAVSAIQGVGKGGSGSKSVGGGSGSRGGGDAAGQTESGTTLPALNRSLTIIGDRFNRKQAIEIAEFMNEGTDDGLVIRGRR